MTTGQLLRWEVKVKIPVCPTHPTWEEWEVKAQGLNLAVTVQKAALEALTTSYEKHIDLVASTAAKVIPYLSSIPDMGSSTKLFSLLRAILTTILNLSPQSVSPKLCLTPIK
jgi:diacylglycerol kinase